MTAAEKLRQRMQQTKAGWTPDDLDRLYRGFGFRMRNGEKHRVYIHDQYPRLRATVRRSTPLPKGYIETALELLSELDRLQQATKGAQP
jgi:hypothetical protein